MPISRSANPRILGPLPWGPVTNTAVDPRTLVPLHPPRPLGQVGRRRKIGQPRAAKGQRGAEVGEACGAMHLPRALPLGPLGRQLTDTLAEASFPGPMTGFSNHESSMVGKWLELLTQIAPGIKRTAMMFNPDMSPYVRSYYLPFFETGARSLKVEPISAAVRSDSEIETVIASLGREPRGGLIIMPDTFLFAHRAPIISLAARNNVPTVFNGSLYVRDGGLLSYGPDNADVFYRAASDVDRILRGAKTAELPVQLPVKFEMALNAKTAKALGLTVPQSILLRADEVIE
jgi:putative tryptophan/tyrosine transport system substrate-binding protein